MLASDCHFLELEKLKYPLVNQFYKRIYKKGVAGKNEAVFIIKNNRQIICSAKLKSLEEDLLLTGVACDPNFQQQGYASQLVKQLINTRQQPIYCFPYPHLSDFYLRIGFSLISIEEAPPIIQLRFTRYSQHKTLLLMVFK